MNRQHLQLFVGLLSMVSVPFATADTIQLNGHNFTLPAGFTIQRVAGPPLVDRPITAAFDEQGHLYVADSSGSNEPVQQQLQNPTHRIVRLTDTDGDGVFDKSMVFADKMMFPEGTLWLNGSLYVAAPPSIWKLTDTDGDGVADRREEWFKGKTLTGCANDLHGPYAGPDGWIYWCKGAFAEQTYPRPGKKPLVTKAAHIFRARPDGSGIEPVMTGGMDNPVDVVFTPGGERIFTTTFLQHPGGGRRDGLIHAIYGGVYGKDHAPVYDHPWTAPTLMPVLTHLGAAAPSGLTRYESNRFGEAYRDNLFAALFNLRKVTRHRLTAHGATFQTQDEDFVVSDHLDFHPTDVLEDADGSLLIVDTGGWYKLCCPTSQLVKPDVLGAIYRVVPVNKPGPGDPRGLKIAWDKLSVNESCELLGDERPEVRRQAMAILTRNAEQAPAALRKVVQMSASVEARRNAVWTATRLDTAEARAVVRTALDDPDPSVCQVAIHSVSVNRDRQASAKLITLLQASLPVRRAAAEALGRIGDSNAVPALLEAGEGELDRVLEHSITYALMEIGDSGKVTLALQSKPQVRRIALTALEGMQGLKSEMVIRELTSKDGSLKETALWLASRHPEWGEILSGWLRERLSVKLWNPAEQQELAPLMARLAQQGDVQKLLAEKLIDRRQQREARLFVLQAMARSGLRELPDAWIDSLSTALNQEETRLGVLEVLRAIPIAKRHLSTLAPPLRKLSDDPAQSVQVRLQSLVVLPDKMLEISSATFDFLLQHVRLDQPVAQRSLSANILNRAALTSDQLLSLCEALKSTGPMERGQLLEAFGRSGEEAVGRKLVQALLESDNSGGVRAEILRPVLSKFSPQVQKESAALLAKLEKELRAERENVDKILSTLEKGDVRRGQIVFNSTKAACAACHAIGYLGGKIGPDLTHIARIRNDRDLLESILVPSASFVRSYEPVNVIARSGKVLNGLVRTETADEIVLTIAVDQEVRIRRSDIESLEPSAVSVMPPGMEKILTRQELADLLAFLRTCR